MSMDGMTMEDKCERLEPCGMCVNKSSNATTDRMQVCSSLHFVCVHVRGVIHVIVHNGLTVVEGVLVIMHTFT